MSDVERVHEASPVRLLQARQDGHVARSAELNRALVFCFLLAAIFLFGGRYQEIAGQEVEQALRHTSIRLSENSLMFGLCQRLLVPIAIVLGSITLLSIATWHFQSPLKFHFDRATPDVSKLSPRSAISRLFSPSTWIRNLVLLSGFAASLVALFLFAWNYSFSLVMIASLDLYHGLELADKFLRNMLFASGLAILALGIVDYIRERIRLAIRLRMSDQERRDEMRNNEMDPNLRRRMFG